MCGATAESPEGVWRRPRSRSRTRSSTASSSSRNQQYFTEPEPEPEPGEDLSTRRGYLVSHLVDQSPVDLNVFGGRSPRLPP